MTNVTLGRCLCVSQGILNRLVASRRSGEDTPAVIVFAEADGRAIVYASIVQCRSNLIRRYPVPGEINVSKVTRLADAGYFDQFTARDSNRNQLHRAHGVWNERAKDIDANGAEDDVPARRRLYAGRALGGRPDDPSAALQNERLRRIEVLVGNDSALEPEDLRILEGLRAGNEAACETPRQEIPRRATDKEAEQDAKYKESASTHWGNLVVTEDSNQLRTLSSEKRRGRLLAVEVSWPAAGNCGLAIGAAAFGCQAVSCDPIPVTFD